MSTVVVVRADADQVYVLRRVKVRSSWALAENKKAGGGRDACRANIHEMKGVRWLRVANKGKPDDTLRLHRAPVAWNAESSYPSKRPKGHCEAVVCPGMTDVDGAAN